MDVLITLLSFGDSTFGNVIASLMWVVIAALCLTFSKFMHK